MLTTIFITDTIRSLPYFSDLKEESVSIPYKPFGREILTGKITPESLSIDDLQKCIATCIYFTCDTMPFVKELMWQITRNQGLVGSWFIQNPPTLDSNRRFKSYARTFHNSDDDSPRSENMLWLWDPQPDQKPVTLDSETNLDYTLSFHPNVEEPLRSELVSKIGSELNRPTLIQYGARFLKSSYEEICRGGNIKLLKWTHLKWKAYKCEPDNPILYYSWGTECTASAALGGHLEVLQYLVKCGCETNFKTTMAAVGGCHLECIENSGTKLCSENPQIYDPVIKRNRSVECLQYLHSIRCEWDENTVKAAARRGRLDCLKYLYENECKGTTDILDYAVKSGSIECIKYLYENGYTWNEKTFEYACIGDHLECLKYLRDKGCPWNSYTCVHLSILHGRTRSLEFIKYAHENGCSWDEKMCIESVENSKLDCLKYLHENGCPWNESACQAAAKTGNLECLKYLHENGCPWGIEASFAAAGGGHLECLKYLHENGCSWNIETFKHAAGGGHLECFKYLHENGCPWDHTLYKAIGKKNKSGCFEYAFDHGCFIPRHEIDLRHRAKLYRLSTQRVIKEPPSAKSLEQFMPPQSD